MNDYRLDLADWYDKERDLVQCQACGKWLQSIESQHLKKCGFASSADYKRTYGILPHTPLRSKRLLERSARNTRELREKGVLKVWKKGETSIPESYQFGSTAHTYDHSGEYSEILSASLTGKKKGEKHVQAMRSVMMAPDKRYRVRDAYRAFLANGGEPANKGKGTKAAYVCQECGERRETYPSVAANRKFCSHRCAGLAREREKRKIAAVLAGGLGYIN